MADNVCALPGVVISEGKQTFLDAIAAAYDELSERDDGEPVCAVFSFVTVNGHVRTGYATKEEVEQRNSLYIARAVSCLHMDLASWDGSGN